MTYKACVHFVGFERSLNDPRVRNAMSAFGVPDIWHRVWDSRAIAEVAPEDTVVFAEGDENQEIVAYTYDDSSIDVKAYERSIGEK